MLINPLNSDCSNLKNACETDEGINEVKVALAHFRAEMFQPELAETKMDNSFHSRFALPTLLYTEHVREHL